MPGEGCLLGGGGGFATSRFFAAIFDEAFRLAATFGTGLRPVFAALAFTGFFETAFLETAFLLAACFCLGGATFLDFGDVVIFPGLLGFFNADFLALVARIFADRGERLLFALVLRLLIFSSKAENEPASHKSCASARL
ncbi:MAG TPA: hypothetical protein VNN73_09935 [Blastocatellia bacterium]|nr:hypothetical protein [Blastocatellia bacterium]